MVSVLAFIHLVLSVFLVILVLIQDPKGGGAGGLFGGGGGSSSLFGATGAPTFLARVTRWMAVIFAASCISMTIFIKPGSKSVLDEMEIPAATSPVEANEAMDTAPMGSAPDENPSSPETPEK
jgi:preprotein translocase subunit SecG